MYEGISQKYTMACSVHEKSARARPALIVVVQPSAFGSIRNKISVATPSDVHAHSNAPAVVANMASGTGKPGCSLFHRRKCETTSATQIQDPVTAIRMPT